MTPVQFVAIVVLDGFHNDVVVVELEEDVPLGGALLVQRAVVPAGRKQSGYSVSASSSEATNHVGINTKYLYIEEQFNTKQNVVFSPIN